MTIAITPAGAGGGLSVLGETLRPLTPGYGGIEIFETSGPAQAGPPPHRHPGKRSASCSRARWSCSTTARGAPPPPAPLSRSRPTKSTPTGSAAPDPLPHHHRAGCCAAVLRGDGRRDHHASARHRAGAESRRAQWTRRGSSRMTGTRTRTYDSPHRQAQQEETRRRIVEAFIEQLADPGTTDLSPSAAARSRPLGANGAPSLPRRRCAARGGRQALEARMFPVPVVLPTTPAELVEMVREVYRAAEDHLPLLRALVRSRVGTDVRRRRRAADCRPSRTSWPVSAAVNKRVRRRGSRDLVVGQRRRRGHPRRPVRTHPRRGRSCVRRRDPSGAGRPRRRPVAGRTLNGPFAPVVGGPQLCAHVGGPPPSTDGGHIPLRGV